MELMCGRPSDTAGREEKEIRVYDFLDAIGVEYMRVDHPAAMTMEVCADIDKTLGAAICKNLFLCNRQKTAFYLLMIKDDKVFKTKDIPAQIGSARLSFASPEDMERLLGLTPGSVSVMGLMNDTEKAVKLLVDEDVLKAEYFGCHPCVNTSSLKISVRDLTEKILPALGRQPAIVKL